MREIKFRAWDGEQMIYPDYIDRNGVAWWKENSIPTNSKLVMQYTGRKDKNGVVIYEGDIIPCKVGVQNYANWVVGDENAMLNGVVEWNEHQMCWEIGFKKNKYSIICCRFGWGSTPVLEVIGNIYQNPELLK